ncbi:glycerol kinase [Anaerolentibacter hominis]|uniref:FGGY-family carbohydrate kinase n=1 Tax=Anaerolentibacter hominis TaxID=3079009 RepID=UPI0031B8745C
MKNKYILGIDQSTQGTKGLLFNGLGELVCRTDLPHRQMIDERGYVEHDPEEIYHNTCQVVKNLLNQADIPQTDIVGIGISNQRETALMWEKKSGKPVYPAVVWQCARGETICNRLDVGEFANLVKSHTGLNLSPYFSAAKLAWILENVEGVREKAVRGELCAGTVDSWLIFKLTGGTVFKTDYSNASRTQLFDIRNLCWDEEICRAFGIPVQILPEVCDSNSLFGETDFEGAFDRPLPIHAVLGDSHGALFGQGCIRPGMVKATYGTGSSVMMNIGEKPVFGKSGVVTSLAWGMDGVAEYVLEGNINYTGAVISWLKDDLKMIRSAGETEELAKAANPKDQTYLVPAFTGLGAPYWDSKATGIIKGITRTTGQAEVVRAALDCIAYQITDILRAMEEDAGISIQELRVDGGPTRNSYLMQFQSDMADIPVQVPAMEELSGIGAAYTAGIALGIYDKEEILSQMKRTRYDSRMEPERRERLYRGWKEAVGEVLRKNEE